MLAHRLDLPIDAFADPHLRLRLAPEAQEGTLDDGWTYWFHGWGCQFAHSATGQTLDIRLGFCDEWAVPGPCFFYRFVATTPDFRALASLFDDAYHDVERAFDILEQRGYLKRVSREDSSGGGRTLVHP